MPPVPSLPRRPVAALAAALTATAVALGASPAVAAPTHSTVVSDVPTTRSPDISDGRVYAIHDAGTKIIAAGSFTTVQNRNSDTDMTRNYVLAFNKATGAVDSAFAPVLDNEVNAVIAGPTPGTVFLAGKFNTVNGVNRRKVALVNVSDGALVSGFGNTPFNGAINDIALVGSRLLVAGIFTTAGAANPRAGLASLDASTGAVDSYLTTALTGNHTWDGVAGARAGVGGEKLAISPDGTQLVVIGNFRNADGVLHDQIVKLDLGATAATIADWNTTRYTPRCRWQAFDTYMRDVAFSPDGSFFVVVTTGSRFAGTLCDTAARWEAAATGGALQPTWVNYSGGDTFLSVAVSERAVYVGGHLRWLNNSFGSDTARDGAVGRASIAALDPVNGLPLAWNPGRRPRNYGVTEMYLTPEGLWLGSDDEWIGDFEYRRGRIAFFPLTGGAAPHPANAAALPGKVYQAGGTLPTNTLYRLNAGGPLLLATDGGPDWLADNSSTSPYRNSGSSASNSSTVGGLDATVPAGTPIGIFSSERWDNSPAPELEWELPVPAGTEVEVRLYFANRCGCTQAAGQRQFTVSLDGAPMLTDFDIVAQTGHNRGTMRSAVLTSDGTVDIDFTHVVEHPLINGIEIVRTGPPPPVGTANDVTVRSYDGAAAIGAPTPVANPDGTAWSGAKAAFWVGGTLFYAMSGGLHRRAFDGTTFGPPSAVDPYHDPQWDLVETDAGPEGQTYAGVLPNFYPELHTVTGMFFAAGRLYYTLYNQNALFWRWFTPDTGVVGADRFTVPGSTGFADAAAVMVSGQTLYVVRRGSGDLTALSWVDNTPVGPAAVLSGPAVDGVDWRAKAVFVGP
ncbi:MAG TPA: malectin domain-containing carbohydrate-binding protein [Pilimelia sp.]|nr:malectin domain-containing carbohydrate-binding protein [Pilimelia sp.]